MKFTKFVCIRSYYTPRINSLPPKILTPRVVVFENSWKFSRGPHKVVEATSLTRRGLGVCDVNHDSVHGLIISASSDRTGLLLVEAFPILGLATPPLLCNPCSGAHANIQPIVLAAGSNCSSRLRDFGRCFGVLGFRICMSETYDTIYTFHVLNLVLKF